MGEENIPLESPVLTEGISWDKGCYIGQEVIARMHYRGQPNRYLRRIALVSDRCPAPGTQLIDGDERVIGRMGTAAFHPPSDAWMGLAVMKRKFAEAGQKVWDPEGEVGTVLLEDAAGSE
jgi:folate-binding protein YgfZ